MGVVVKNESNMTTFFPEAVKLNGSNADMYSYVALPSRSGSCDLFDLSDRSNKTDPESLGLLAAILDLSVNTTPILLFGHTPQKAEGSCGHGQIQEGGQWCQ